MVIIVILTASVSVFTMSTNEKSGYVMGNTDIPKMMPYKTRDTPGHLLVKRSPFKKILTVPLLKKGLLVSKLGLVLAKKGLLIGK